jgi:hypothetical protein
MTKVALFFVLKNLTPSMRMMLHRRLYSYKDVSNYGKYIYKRKGILETVKHRELSGKLLILSQEDAPKFIKIFKKYNIKHYMFNIK